MLKVQFVIPNAEAFAAQYAKAGSDARQFLDDEVQSLTEELLAKVVSGEPVLTGRLHDETRAAFSDSRGIVRGRIFYGVGKREAIKIAALEYGAHRNIPVRAYTRGKSTAVDAYNRRVSIMAHRFLRDPFEEMQPEINERIDAALSRMVDEANA